MSIARVLVIDDDAAVRRALASALARGGFDVSTAGDGAPALRLVQIATPELVLVDYNMPTDGLAVVQELRSRYGAAIYVAVLTGEENEKLRRRCLDAGADDVLIKPILPVELRRLLTAAALALKVLPIAS